MKKMLLLLVITMTVVACKNENSKTSNDPQFEGEFIYIDDGAVLKGDTFIYGVTLDDMAKELKDKVAPIKKDDYDMVAVVVKGIVEKKAEGADTWDEILTITEIVSVSDTPSEADIKIEDKKEADSSK